MATFKRFEDIEAWQLARELCKQISVISSKGPFQKDFELKNQIRGSSGYIMDNIAEGFGRDGNREFIQFLSFSKGSANETQSQLYRALDSQYIDADIFHRLYKDLDQIIGKITRLMQYLSKSPQKGIKYDNPKRSSEL